jgi:hypothetical protein
VVSRMTKSFSIDTTYILIFASCQFVVLYRFHITTEFDRDGERLDE